MLRVGLTGGIASGKSTVSALLASYGAVVIDYDMLARDAVELGSPALDAIATRFGPAVVQADGTLDRPALGAVVFADVAARKDLEAITHPAIRDLAMQQEKSAGSADIVVHDNPLLIEMGANVYCDVVLVVDVPVEVQVKRLMDTRGMTEDEALARIGSQTSRDERNSAADVVIDNTGPLDELAHTVAGVWDELVLRTTA